jgi:hypothetical protein
MVYYIYHAPNINRLFAEDYLEYFRLSPFEVETFELLKSVTTSEETKGQLSRQCPGHQYFEYSGIMVILKKQ